MLIHPEGGKERICIKQLAPPNVPTWAKFFSTENEDGAVYIPVLFFALYTDEEGFDMVVGLVQPATEQHIWSSAEEGKDFRGYKTRLPEGAVVFGE